MQFAGFLFYIFLFKSEPVVNLSAWWHYLKKQLFILVYNTNVPMIAGIIGAFIAILALVGAGFATYALMKSIMKYV